MLDASARQVTSDLMNYIQRSPTSAHSVRQAVHLFEKEGFARLNETDAWIVKPDSGYFVTRGAGSLVAFRTGTLSPEQTGFRVIGAHTDSPGFRIKPNGCYRSEGYVMLGVEVYGGPLLASWTDRDLSLAGRVVCRQGQGTSVKLVDLKRPVCRIPQLAVHLNRNVNDKGLLLNRQKHLPPILGIDTGKQCDGWLESLLEDTLQVSADQFIDYSLYLYDTQAPTFGGFEQEFYFSPRIDNLAGCYGAMQALLHAPESDPATRMIVLFDNEEIGSLTPQGADSNLIDAVAERLCLDGPRPRENLLRALAKTIMVSSDGAHALHPNYSDKHDKHHQPMLNQGPVIKVHAAKKFATTAESRAHFLLCAQKAGVSCQVFVNRSDQKSGSTLGPISSTRLGVSTVDVGVPMLSMHSVRETGGVEDLRLMILALVEHFTTES